MSPSLAFTVAGVYAFSLICTVQTDPPLPPIAESVEPESTRSQPSVTIAFSITLMELPPVLITDEPQSSAQIPTAAGATRPGV